MTDKRKPVDSEILKQVEEAIIARASEQSSSPDPAVIAHVRALKAREAEREDQSLKSYLDEITGAGMKATGLSKDQLLEKAKEYESTGWYRPPTRSPRELARARGVPELHLRGVADREPVRCDALQGVQELLGSTKQVFLVLAGAVGVRKSGSACWALTRHEGRYVLSADLPDLSINPERKDEWARIRSAELLVIDELSGEYTDDKGFFYQVFGRLTQERYAGCLKTIITYNRDAASFRATYGDRAADRINEGGRFLEIGGQSVRGTVEHWAK